MVFHANRHPGASQRGDAPDREVTGGIFQGEGRQVMPRRDAPPREASGVRNGRNDGDDGGESGS
jgi:hypothetical protein